MDQRKDRVAAVTSQMVSRSVITVRSRWKDKEWVPEIGSKVRPMPAMPPQGRAYVLDNVIHYITADEIQAGERVGRECYIAYANSTSPAKTPYPLPYIEEKDEKKRPAKKNGFRSGILESTKKVAP